MDGPRNVLRGQDRIFADVPATHPFFKQIQLAADKGLFTGCSSTPKNFCPDAQITRGQIAVVAVLALYSQGATGGSSV